MLILGAIILAPAYFVSADEDTNSSDDGSSQQHHPRHPAGIPMEITSISVDADGVGTIEAELVRVPDQVTQDKGVDDGTGVTVTTTSETKFVVDGEEADASDFSVGETIFVGGKIDFEELTIEAKVVSDEHLRPKRPGCDPDAEQAEPSDDIRE